MSNANASNGLAAKAFAGIAGAKARMDANYVRPGVYVLRVDKVKLDKSRKDETFLAVEMTVLSVIEGYADQQKAGQKPHAVGESVTHMMMAKHDSFLGNVKQFLSAVLNTQPDLIDQDAAVAVVGDDQPLSGSIVEVQARNIVTRKGTDFTSVTYRRSISAADALKTLDPTVIARFFPGDYLKKVAEAEEAQQKATA